MISIASNATACPMQNSKRVCQSCFPRFLKRRGGSISLTSLMFQPEHNLVGVLTAAAPEGRQAPSFETVRLSTDALALRGSMFGGASDRTRCAEDL